MSQFKKNRLLTPSESSLWSKAMAKVTPVKRPQNLSSYGSEYTHKHHSRNKFSAEPRQDLKTSDSNIDRSGSTPSSSLVGLKSKQTVPTVQALEVGKVGSTDRRTADRLKKGRMDIDARLDLHGSTLAQAHSRLYGFIVSAQTSGARCVLIVTGKGRSSKGEIGKLKAAVPRWLNEPSFRPHILSLTYAQQKDGGDGALYVLLKKNRNVR